jgi:hypothetical protein
MKRAKPIGFAPPGERIARRIPCELRAAARNTTGIYFRFRRKLTADAVESFELSKNGFDRLTAGRSAF